MPRLASEIYLQSQGYVAPLPWRKKMEELTPDEVATWETMYLSQKPTDAIPKPKDGFDVLKRMVNKSLGRECYWCSAKCTGEYIHGDPPPLPFTKTKSQAKRPASSYQCRGCWLWRRQRIGVNYLTGKWGDGRPRDGQCPLNHSWFICPKEALAIDRHDYAELWQILIKPPTCFVLMLMDQPEYFRNGTVDPKTVVGNQLHLAAANDLDKVEMGTKLKFTLNNVEHSYSVYELENAFRDGGSGKEPGVQALIRFLGSWPQHLTPKAVESVKTVDRKVEPPDAKELKKMVGEKK